MSELRRWGSSYTCLTCKTNYNRRLERNKKDKKLHLEWKNKTKESKVQWFKGNKQAYAKYERAAYTDNVVEDVSYMDRHDTLEDAWDYLPFSQWMRGELIERPGTSRQVLLKEFNDKLNARGAKRRKHELGGWCLGVFVGMKHRVGTTTGEQHQAKRHKVIQSTDDHEEALALAEAAGVVQDQWLDERKKAAAFNMDTSDVPVIDEAAMHPSLSMPVSGSAIMHEMKRDVAKAEVFEAALHDLEDADEHQAQDLARAKMEEARANRGRPQKLMSQKLADAASYIRTRADLVKECAERAKAANELVIEGITAHFKDDWPDDVKTCAEQNKKEMASALEEVEKVRQRVLAISVHDFVQESDTAEDTKGRLSEMTKSVFKIHAKQCRDATTALKKAFNKAQSDARKKAKKQHKGASSSAAPDTVAKPPLVLALCTTSMDGNDLASSMNVSEDIAASLNGAHQVASGNLPEAMLKELKEIKSIAAHMNWLVEHVKSDSDISYQNSDFRSQVADSVQALIKSHLPMLHCGIRFPPASEGCRMAVLQPQAFAMSCGHMHIGVTAYGLPEVRVLLAGYYAVCGLPLDKVAGGSLRSKLDSLATPAGQKEYVDQLKAGSGFIFQHNGAGTVVVLPAGHLLVVFGSYEGNVEHVQEDGAVGIRWSILQKTEDCVQRSEVLTDSLLACFPDLKGSAHDDWLKLCRGFLKAAVASTPLE